jgi:3-oxoadipate enol-lactonase
MLELAATRLAGDDGMPDLLVVGPSLGTSVESLWNTCAEQLGTRCDVVGWDLPGHGRSRVADGPFLMAELAQTVRDLATIAAAGRKTYYAGISLGGAVGFELGVDPGPFDRVASIASAPKIGEAVAWRERAELVRSAGTAALASSSAARWFSPGFAARRPETVRAFLTLLAGTDRLSYALACETLAEFDLRARLHEVKVPMLIAPGEEDVVIPPAVAKEAAEAVPGSVFRVLAGCGHLPSAEDPAAVAALLTDFIVQEVV